MATTVYFEEVIKDQGGKYSMNIEIGHSSYYDEASIYIRVGNDSVIMDYATAKRFVEAVVAVGQYHQMID